MPEQKKFTGRGGYHGGGRKTLDPTGKGRSLGQSQYLELLKRWKP